jgi:hypothetical protein
MPPLWGHHVTTLEASVSLAVWSSCLETDAMNAALSAALPFAADWSSEQVFAATLQLLQQLVLAVFQSNCESPDLLDDCMRESVQFLRDLARFRYSAPVRQTLDDGDHNGLHSDARVRPSVLKCNALMTAEYRHAHKRPHNKKLAATIASFVETSLVPLFARVQESSRRKVWLGDYVEVALNNIVEDVADMSHLLQCFIRFYSAMLRNDT